MTESNEFSNMGSYEVEYQHAYCPTSIYSYPISTQYKMEPSESPLPPINEVFNEPLQAHPSVFDSTWQNQSAYKEFSPCSIDNSYPTYQFDVNSVEKLAESNGFTAWRPDASTPLTQPLANEFMANQLQAVHGFQIYDQNSLSSIYAQSPDGTILCHVPPMQEPSPISALDYQPIYTHSPSTIDSQNFPLTAFNLNVQNDISESNDLYYDSLFQGTSESSSAGTPQTSGSPITSSHLAAGKKALYRTTRNGKVVKKVTQNCHANSQCSNCKTMDTTLWRRNSGGEVECNACNLYFRKNGTRRPVKLQKRGIMRRTRNPRQPYLISEDYMPFKISP